MDFNLILIISPIFSNGQNSIAMISEYWHMKKNSKFFLTVILFLISFIITCGCLAIYCINVGMDVYYHHQYPIIEDEGNSTINKIVDGTSQYGTNSTRLIIIADIICENFTDSYWESQWSEEYFCPYPNNEKTGWAWCPPFGGFFEKNPHSYWYVFDKKGHVRTTISKFIDLTYDPKWIAYQRTGACEALSILFNETANRSGFESRIVTSANANHTWNEVKINGEWKYYDVQRYGQVKNTNESSFWFGNRSEYGYKSGFNHSELTKNGICVFDLQKHKCGDEKVTQNYSAQS